METMKVSVMVETSRDGCITSPNGELNKFQEVHDQLVPKGETFGFREYLSSVDAVVMGRKTFDSVKVTVPEQLKGKIVFLSGEPRQIVDNLRSRGIEKLHLDGGAQVFRDFMDARLIAQVTVIELLVDFGGGTPFLSQEHWSRLKIQEEIVYECGYTKRVYSVDNEQKE